MQCTGFSRSALIRHFFLLYLIGRFGWQRTSSTDFGKPVKKRVPLKRFVCSGLLYHMTVKVQIKRDDVIAFNAVAFKPVRITF